MTGLSRTGFTEDVPARNTGGRSGLYRGERQSGVPPAHKARAEKISDSRFEISEERAGANSGEEGAPAARRFPMGRDPSASLRASYTRPYKISDFRFEIAKEPAGLGQSAQARMPVPLKTLTHKGRSRSTLLRVNSDGRSGKPAPLADWRP